MNPPSIPPLSQSQSDSRRVARRDYCLAAVFTLTGLVLSIVMALYSDGVHHDDDLVHLQFARWSFEYPEYLLHEWGRPGFTVLYALPAQLGWTAARIFSGLLTALTGWLAFLIARKQGLGVAAAVPALFWLQPMTFTLSYTTLTEPVLAFYLTLGMWLLQHGRYVASAAVISLTMVTRHEAALFLALWSVALWKCRASWFTYLALLWAPIVHNVLSAMFLWSAPLLMFLDPKPTAQYGSGGWHSMPARWLLAAGVGPVLLACIGAPAQMRRPWGWLWIACGLAYLAAHTVLFRYGLFATGGYYRFLVAIGPVVAVAAAEGVNVWFRAIHAMLSGERGSAVRRALTITAVCTAVLAFWVDWELPAWMDWLRSWSRVGAAALIAGCILATGVTFFRRPRLGALAARLVPLFLLVICIWQPVLGRGVQPPFQQAAPLRLTADQLVIRDACTWLRMHGIENRRVFSANAWVFEFADRSQSPFRPEPRDALEQMRAGDVFVWDANYAPAPPHLLSLEQLRARGDLVERWSDPRLYCVIFERAATDAARNPTP